MLWPIPLVTIVILITEGGLSSTDAHDLVLASAGLTAVTLLLTLAVVSIEWFEDATRAARRRRWIRRRRRRVRKPPAVDFRENVLLARLTSDDWIAIRLRAHRSVRSWVARRLLAAPIIAVWTSLITAVALAIFLALPKYIGVPIVLIGAGGRGLYSLANAVADPLDHLSGDPLVFTGRVVLPEAPSKLAPPTGTDNTRNDLAAETQGRRRLMVIQTRSAVAVRPDGTLTSAPQWHGEHRVPVSRWVAHHVYADEHVALVCSSLGYAADRLYRAWTRSSSGESVGQNSERATAGALADE